MPSVLPNFIAAIPEMFVLFMALIVLMIGVFIKNSCQILYYLAQLTLVAVAGLTWYVFSDLSAITFTFHHMFILDYFSMNLKLFIYLFIFFTFLYTREYNSERNISHTEFYALGLLSMLGMMILISAYNLLSVFLGLELLSLPMYTIVAMYRQKTRSIEASMKYFITGAIGSGILLYGMSMIFGATQSMDLSEISRIIVSMPLLLNKNLMLIFGLVFIIVGATFKLGVAPFHMWVPDVYEGASSSATLFISTAPKIATYAMVIRLLVIGMPALQTQWHQILIIIAILSMGIGNFAAIAQSNIKRMLAYSSIAHMGYMLLGILSGTKNGYAAAMFYTITYSLTSLGAFGVVVLMSRGKFEAENIDDYIGLNTRNPWIAFMMMLILFSLAGVPPLVGFIAKVSILNALIQVHLVWLAVLAVLFTIVGAYYYILIIKVMYFKNSLHQLRPIQYSLEMKIAISLNGLAVLFIGIFPEWLYALSYLAL